MRARMRPSGWGYKVAGQLVDVHDLPLLSSSKPGLDCQHVCEEAAAQLFLAVFADRLPLPQDKVPWLVLPR
jgi:hypothetical protein